MSRAADGLTGDVLERLDDILFTTDPEGHLLRWNDRLCEVTGFEDAELASMHLSDLVVDEDSNLLEAALEDALEGGHAAVLADLLHADGSSVAYEFRQVRVTNGDGEVTGTGGLARNAVKEGSSQAQLGDLLAGMDQLRTVVRELALAQTTEEVYQTGIEAAQRVTDCDACRLAVADDESLIPVAAAGAKPVDQASRIPLHTTIAGRTYSSGNPTLIDDATDLRSAAAADSPAGGPPGASTHRSLLTVPIPEVGVIQLLDREPNAFDRTDRDLLELLGAHLGGAAERLRSVSGVPDDQVHLETVASSLARDLQDPMSVAQVRIDLARREGDQEHLDAAFRTLDQADGLVNAALTLIELSRDLEATKPTSLDRVVEEAWQLAGDDQRADLVVEGDLGPVDADERRLCVLLECLFENTLDHAERGVTVCVGPLADGFYVEDDGPGVPAKAGERLFEPGYSTLESQLGYGLANVAAVATAHGWAIQVAESATGGARFEIRDNDRSPA